VNKVFRSALTGVISVGLLSTLSIAPAQAYVEQTNPTDQISLTGTPAVDSVLTLTKQKYSNVTERSYNVSWLRCNSAISLSNKQSDFDALLIAKTCTIISQSTSTTYTVVAADAGKHITGAVYIADFTETIPPSNSKWGISLAPSLLISASTSTPAGGGTTTGDGTTAGGGTNTSGGTQETGSTLPAQALAKAVPAKAKAGKSIKIAAVTNAKVATKVKVKGKGCKVVAVKDKKNKKKIASYKVTMGKKGATCTVTVTAPATATVAALNSVTKVKAS
jgi:hypothetical protein